MLFINFLHFDSKMCQKSPLETAKSCELAADQNQTEVQFKYGLCLEKGDVVSLYHISAAKLY
jgi:hypothetical protein